MFDRWYAWRVRRSYRTIGAHEHRLGKEAIELRGAFVSDSARILDALYAMHNINRTTRRQMKRDWISGGSKKKGEQHATHRD